MSAKFVANKKILQTVKKFSPGINNVSIDVELPTTINIITDGKDNNNDTLLDDKGNVIKDKFLRIDEISIDKKPIDTNALYKIIKIHTVEKQLIYSNYVGFNGVTSINLEYSDSLIAHLQINSLLG
tara:strand:+ start:5291 stop:5668 length:378 start_codon:yes stop_codon:yes gene_type:complete